MTPHNDREVDSSKLYSTCMTWEIIDVVAQYLGSREVSYCTQNSIRCLATKHTVVFYSIAPNVPAQILCVPCLPINDSLI